MSYVDAIHDKSADIIHVVERSPAGERIFKEYPTNYVMYYEDSKGKHFTINLTRLASSKSTD